MSIFVKLSKCVLWLKNTNILLRYTVKFLRWRQLCDWPQPVSQHLPTPLIFLECKFKIVNPVVISYNRQSNEAICNRITIVNGMANQDNQYRVVVFGAGRVGKSSLVLRFLKNTFPQSYVPTVEDFYSQNVEFLSYTLNGQWIPCKENSVCNLEIVDTAGSYSFPAMQRLNISKGHAFIMVYSVTSRQTLEQLESIWETILEIKGSLDNVPLMLVGNKCDEIEARELTIEEGQEQARQWSSSFIETSAKASYNVKKLFRELLLLEKTRSLRIPQDFQELRIANAKSWP